MATVHLANDADASAQVTQDPAAPQCVSSRSSACSQPIGHHAAGPSQGSSNAKANSDGTTVTPPNQDDRLKLLRDLTTPAGYHLGPHEGWNPSRPSLERYLPKSSISSPRRNNAKNSGHIPSLAVPAPEVTPEYEHVEEHQGLKLCCVSDAVPYLLGSYTLADRIQAILEHGLRYAEKLYDTSDGSQGEPLPYSDRDRALMAILSSLQTPEFQRRERGNWYPQGLATPKGRLQLYKHMGPGVIEPTQVKLSGFIKMAQAWHLTPNPARFASDLPSAKNSWADILPKLRAREVDFAKIDLDLYYELTMNCPSSDLSAKLDEVAQWSQDGTLDQRFASWTQQVAQLCVTNKTDKGCTNGMYSKRYTHRFPLGRPRSEMDDLEKAERKANRANAAGTHHTLTEKAEDKAQTWWARKKEQRRSVAFTALMTLFFGSIIGAMVWGVASNSSWDYTTAGATK